jgi:hypothetical protein
MPSPSGGRPRLRPSGKRSWAKGDGCGRSGRHTFRVGGL